MELVAGTLPKQWIEKTVSGTRKINSVINANYCMDFWTGSSNYENCDVYTESPSYNQDQAIDNSMSSLINRNAIHTRGLNQCMTILRKLMF